MNQVTSMLRLVAPQRGLFAGGEVLRLAEDEAAVVLGKGPGCRMLYGEDAALSDDEDFTLKATERALLMAREFTASLSVPVLFSDGYEADVALVLRARLLRPDSGDQHPVLTRCHLAGGESREEFEAGFCRVLVELLTPAVERCVAGRAYLALDWSVGELQAEFDAHSQRMVECEELGLRQVDFWRITSASGEAYMRRQSECLRSLREAESQEEFDRRSAELAASRMMREEELAGTVAMARAQREHHAVLERLVAEGELAKAQEQLEIGLLELAGQRQRLVDQAELLEEEKQAARERARHLQSAEAAEQHARMDLVRLSVEERELDVQLKRLGCERAEAEIQQLREHSTLLADQMAGLHDLVQKLGADLRESIVAARPKAEPEYRVTWRSFHAMTAPWDAGRLRLDRESLENFDFVHSGQSLQVRVESDVDAYVYVLSLGPHAANGSLEYRWTRLLSNHGANDAEYAFAKGFDNHIAAGQSLLLPAAGGSADPADTVWTLNAAPGRELLYVLFSPERISDRSLAEAMVQPPVRHYTTRGFLKKSERQTLSTPGNVEAWDATQEDFRQEASARLREFTHPGGVLVETVLYHG